MITRAAILSLVLTFSFSSLAVAQSPSRQEGQQACEADVHRLCEEFVPNEDEIAGCLKQHLRHLSPACRKIMSH
ncbi:MAG: hypothetical protein ABSA13_07145 [Beijerinckiaceae bacterium]|jgi:hypothetical protein